MLFGIPILYIWVAIIIITIAVEAFTLSLASIWFSAGALAALIAANFELDVWKQLFLFIVVSALLLALIRPLTVRFLHVKNEKTNADRIVGEIAIVTSEINNMHSQGEIAILGQRWTARSVDGTIFPVDTHVRVTQIAGVKAMVDTVKGDNNKAKEERK